MTLTEFIDFCTLQASAGLAPDAAATLIDAEDIIESLLPSVFQKVGVEAAKNEETRSILRREKTITFTSGTGVLTDDVLTQYKEDSTLFDNDNPTTEYSLCQTMTMFAGLKDTREGYYLMNGQTIKVIQPGASFDPASGLTGDLKLTIPCVPEVPATADTELDVPSEILNDLLDAVTIALRGTMEKAA
jgi:hypothetical protein